MTIKNAPWLPEFMAEMELQEAVPGFWTDAKHSRCIYFGDASVVITSGGDTPDKFESQHIYEGRITAEWMFEAICDHMLQMQERHGIRPDLKGEVQELRRLSREAVADLPKDPLDLN